jgi:6-phosphofructokinase 1
MQINQYSINILGINLKMMRKIGVFTSGGDSPGMNAAIRAVVRTALYNKVSVVGILNGYQGMIDGLMNELSFSDVGNIIQRGGTFLGSARSKDFLSVEGRALAYNNLKRMEIDGLIVIGGDGSYKGALTFQNEYGIPINGLPGTIDNDIYGTDATIGFDTALNTVVEAVDKIRDTASSHHRVFFVEVMGRHTGFIGLDAGIAIGAEMALIPEELTDIDSIVVYLKRIRGQKKSSIILVSEGDDAGGAIEIMNRVKAQLADFDVRASVLGHMQRGGNPSAYDRILASRLGVKATEDLINGTYGCAYGVKGNDVISLPFDLAIAQNNPIDTSKLRVIEILSHC